jgi:hypothetical protein
MAGSTNTIAHTAPFTHAIGIAINLSALFMIPCSSFILPVAFSCELTKAVAGRDCKPGVRRVSGVMPRQCGEFSHFRPNPMALLRNTGRDLLDFAK